MIYNVYLINIWKFREKPWNKTILRKCHIGIIWYWVHIHISIFQGILCYTVICWKSQIGFLNRNSNVAIWLTANSWKYFKMTFVKKIYKNCSMNKTLLDSISKFFMRVVNRVSFDLFSIISIRILLHTCFNVYGFDTMCSWNVVKDQNCF